MEYIAKEKEFIDVEEAAEVLGKSIRTARWFISTSYTAPSKIAIDALRETSPEDSGNFKTVIKRNRGRGITGRYKWSVRRDFVARYRELVLEKEARIHRRKIEEAQEKADREVLKQELEQRKQSRTMESVQTAPPAFQPTKKPKQRNNPLTDDEKINLVLKTTNEPTKEIMRALILELEKKNNQIETAEERAQHQIATKDAQIQELLTANNHLIHQLTTQQEAYQEPQAEQEQEPDQQETHTMEMPLPHHNPFVAHTNNAYSTPATLASYPPPIPSPLEYQQQAQSKPQNPHHRLGFALWVTLTALVVAVVLLIFVLSDII